jgi:hypothetical protein
MSIRPNKGTPIANGKILTYPTKIGDAHQIIGSQDWFKWLKGDGNTKFYCDGYPHSYTARREKRRKKYYWYAYMKKDERVYKVYMGQSDKLTHEHIFHEVPRMLDDKWYS